jgi:peptidylprolyl isomerase
MAYKGIQGAPQGTLVFDIELVDLIKTPPPPPAPDDVAAPPADAQKTPSGIAYKILQPGTGKERPVETSKVTVHYTGWTTDGKMFDSSITRNQPANFSLNQVIKGWTEGLQLMTKGEKRRFWIPEELAYKGQPGRPQGTLVFDVELIDFAAPPKAPKTSPRRRRTRRRPRAA